MEVSQWFCPKKGTTKADDKGGPDGLLAPQQGATAATNQPQASTHQDQPTGPHQDRPFPLDNVDNDHEQTAPTQPAAPAAAPAPVPQQEPLKHRHVKQEVAGSSRTPLATTKV